MDGTFILVRDVTDFISRVTGKMFSLGWRQVFGTNQKLWLW